MADYLLSKQFLEELSAFEKSVSVRDIANLDQAMAAIVQNPNYRAESQASTIPPRRAISTVPATSSSIIA
ncbi:MAG TPA: hypothetical protein VIH18_14615 [Candidatus Binatia bacterium]